MHNYEALDEATNATLGDCVTAAELELQILQNWILSHRLTKPCKPQNTAQAKPSQSQLKSSYRYNNNNNNHSFSYR